MVFGFIKCDMVFNIPIISFNGSFFVFKSHYIWWSSYSKENLVHHLLKHSDFSHGHRASFVHFKNVLVLEIVHSTNMGLIITNLNLKHVLNPQS